MMINYRKLFVALLVGASVVTATTPALARSGTSVLTPEEQAFTRSRQSGVKYVPAEQAAPVQEVESLESKAASKAAKHHKHKKNKQEAQVEPEYGTTTPVQENTRSARSRKKSEGRGSVLSP